MVEIFAILRKEKSYEVKKSLASEGIPYVAWTVKGRGKEGGFRYKGFIREKILIPFLPKTAFLIFSEPNNYKSIVELIMDNAHTGSFGDGKIFVLKNEEVSKVKMIKAVIRPEKAPEVVKALDKEGFKALTMWDVVGRGKEGGLRAGEALYDELAKTFLLIAVEDKDVKKAIDTIMKSARTGAYGDGKVFVCDISEVWTVRTKKQEL
ncbi:MAG TPA: P-II family nitrogen regulator [Aquificaceae bacterium]|nr:P-II family nitrogen regulator [Aquificaceae bacterium]HIQ48521.1 P-II family nitrogen regulator [Aquifex aeolicus]